MPVLHVRLDLVGRRDNVLNKVLDSDLLDLGKLSGLAGRLPGKHLEDAAVHSPGGVGVPIEDVAHRYVVGVGESPAEGVQIAELRDSLLRAREHLLCKDRFGSLIICGRDHCLISSHGRVKVHASGDIGEKRSDRGTPDL